MLPTRLTARHARDVRDGQAHIGAAGLDFINRAPHKFKRQEMTC
jgi:hypothetical protein